MRFGTEEQQLLASAARAFDVACDHPPVQHQTWFRQQWAFMGMQQQHGAIVQQQQQRQDPQEELKRRQQQAQQRQM